MQHSFDYKGSTVGAVIDIIGWILFGICLLVAAFGALSGEIAVAASGAEGALAGLVLVALGVIVSKLHSIEYYTRTASGHGEKHTSMLASIANATLRANLAELPSGLRNAGAPVPSGTFKTED